MKFLFVWRKLTAALVCQMTASTAPPTQGYEAGPLLNGASPLSRPYPSSPVTHPSHLCPPFSPALPLSHPRPGTHLHLPSPPTLPKPCIVAGYQGVLRSGSGGNLTHLPLRCPAPPRPPPFQPAPPHPNATPPALSPCPFHPLLRYRSSGRSIQRIWRCCSPAPLQNAPRSVSGGVAFLIPPPHAETHTVPVCPLPAPLPPLPLVQVIRAFHAVQPHCVERPDDL